MDSGIAIKTEGLEKVYRLGAIGRGTLQRDIQSRMARLLGREDPNSRVNDDGRYAGKHCGTVTSSGRQLARDEFAALDGISIEIKKGEAVGLIGKNGAGKSTLLKLLSRVTAPSAGRIYLNGRASSMLEVGTGFNAELTGRENIFLNGAILGMSRAETASKLDEIIEFSECERFIDTPVKRYSSGMYVKLAFSVASHLNSDIMIMDEVLAVGDIEFRKKCISKMRSAAARQGKTVLYVSHSMDTVRSLCSRCILLEGGRVAFDGGVEEGISLYTGSVESELRGVNDLTERRRYSDPLSGVRMTAAEVLVSSGEALKLSITVEGVEPHEKLVIRTIIFDRIRTPVGSFDSTPFDTGGSGVVKFTVSSRLTGLTEGIYSADLELYRADRDGSLTRLDAVREAFMFKLASSDSSGLLANPSRWGSIRFPRATVEEEH